MPSGIPYDEVRQQMILAHMKDQERSPGGRESLPHQKIVIQGRVQQMPVYRFALEELAFNKANGRIKSEVLEMEEALGHDLEPSSADDQARIKKLLLAIRPDENEKIRVDLKKNGQLQPGIVTCDGFVVNGNRRKAILEELYEQTSDERYKYLDVHVLPPDITKSELWLIEAGIQLSAQQQLDYSPINHLLKLRDGRNAGLTVSEMAQRIYGVSEDKIELDLKRLDLIDEYLADYLGKVRRYYLVKQLNEHFINLQNILAWAKHRHGRIQWDWDPDDSDRTELKIVGFHYIRLGVWHMTIRGLRNIFAKREAWQQLRQAVELDTSIEVVESPQGADDSVPIPEPSVDEDDATSYVPLGDPELAPLVEQHDLAEEHRWRRAKERPLKGFYEDAKEQLQIVTERSRPTSLAQRALRMLEGIRSLDEATYEPELDDIFRKIVSVTNELRKAVQKQKKRPR